MTQHTLKPNWWVFANLDGASHIICGEFGKSVHVEGPGSKERAAQLVTAVNAHAQLVKALQRVLPFVDEYLHEFNNPIGGECDKALMFARKVLREALPSTLTAADQVR